MGCCCSCFGVPQVEESAAVVVSSNQNSAPFSYFTQIIENKYGVVSSNPGLQTIPSSAQRRVITTTEVGTNTPRDTLLQNSSSPRNLELEGYVAEQENGSGSAPLQLEHWPPKRHNVQVNLCSRGKDIRGRFSQDNKAGACRFASPVNMLSSEKVQTEHKEDFCLTRDEVECPTCLEEYTDENPKITSKCNHHFHLSCIYEWMERSSTCPMCFEEMKFAENI